MSHTSFLGIPVDGEITRSDRKDQRPLEEFEPLVQALLDDETIVEFGWRQYTPYFNDGEPCEFGAHGLWVRTTADTASAAGENDDEDDEDEDDDEDDEDGLEVSYGHPSLGKVEWDWVGEWPNRQRVVKSYEGPDRGRLDRCMQLHEAVDGGHFDDVLLELFGDHARVVVRRTGISVTSYDHE